MRIEAISVFLGIPSLDSLACTTLETRSDNLRLDVFFFIGRILKKKNGAISVLNSANVRSTEWYKVCPI